MTRLPEHVAQEQQPRVTCRPEGDPPEPPPGRRQLPATEQRLRGLVPGAFGGDRDELLLRVAQRGQAAAEHAPGVQAQGVVHPLRLRGGRVPVQHHGPAPVVVRPRVADRQAVLVGLPGGVPVQREAAHPAGRPALVGLLQPGMRDDQPPAVQDQVRHQATAEVTDLPPELLVLGGQLAERLGQAVTDLHVAPVQGADQLVLVVPGHGQGVPGGHHAHHQPEHAGAVRAPVHQVAEEHRGAAGRRHRAVGPPRRVTGEDVAELPEQGFQLGPAAVHVADHVERPGPVGVVGAQRLPDDGGRRHLGGPVQPVDRPESLPGERSHASGAARHAGGGSPGGRRFDRPGSRFVLHKGFPERPARWRPGARRARGPGRPGACARWPARWWRRSR